MALALEALSVLVIAIGGAQAAYAALWPLLTGGATFMLAADIVRTVIPPTWMEIGQLAAIAVIRTLLNFFLERDLEAVARAAWDGAEPRTSKESQ